jgi:hypothetical protein
MAHVFESAPTGRAKCRGCGELIGKGEIRFGERLPNPFAEGEMTLWFHPMCAAYKRPEPMLEALAASTGEVADREKLELAAKGSMAHRRLERIDGAERAKGQAACRHCREPIPKGTWRIRLTFFDEGQFSSGGFIHLACIEPYFETRDILEQVLHFSRALCADDREELGKAIAATH